MYNETGGLVNSTVRLLQMNIFRETFRKSVEDATTNLMVPPLWEKSEEKDLVVLPKQNPNGFDVCLECMDYGVYPYTDGWRGGCWDVTAWDPEILDKALTEFISSVMEDAVLIVDRSNEKPYRWSLHYLSDGKRVIDKTSSLFFNWFGSRSSKNYCNGRPAT